jgi:hypothetical protein
VREVNLTGQTYLGLVVIMMLLDDPESTPIYPPAEPQQACVDDLDGTTIIATPTLTQRQAPSTTLETCGYQDGNPSIPRSAELGYDCRTDTNLGLWGFCSTNIALASDCGFAGVCVDKASCSTGCGLTGLDSGVSTIAW